MSRSLGERVRQARVERGLTQQKLGAEAGVDGQTISRIERGESENPESATVTRIARALGVSERWLLTGETGEPQGASPAPRFWGEFLARYAHLSELDNDDLEGIKWFAARHLNVQSWVDIERAAEMVRIGKSKPSKPFRAVEDEEELPDPPGLDPYRGRIDPYGDR